VTDATSFRGMDAATRARLRYPFPVLVNPHAAAVQEYTACRWIDGECAGFVPADVAEQFKKTRTGYMTSYFFPMATWERLLPLARMMLFSLYQDDVYERARPTEVREVGARTVAVARGERRADEAGIMLGPQIESLRAELLRFIPPESVARWAADLQLYFEGLADEAAYLESGEHPSLEEYLLIREKALMLHPFMALKEVETQIVLPPEIHDHAAVRRLKSLAVRIVGHFNEFQSYEKDMRTGMGNLNLIRVLMNEYDSSLPEAWERALDMHAAELAEFVSLQRALPEFGEWQDAVENHIHHIAFVISGWRRVDSVVQRYSPEHFIETGKLRASVREAI
jgi:hypothetical protein